MFILAVFVHRFICLFFSFLFLLADTFNLIETFGFFGFSLASAALKGTMQNEMRDSRMPTRRAAQSTTASAAAQSAEEASQSPQRNKQKAMQRQLWIGDHFLLVLQLFSRLFIASSQLPVASCRHLPKKKKKNSFIN